MIDPMLLNASELTSSIPGVAQPSHEDLFTATSNEIQIDPALEGLGTSASAFVKPDPEHSSPNMLHQPSIEIGADFAVPEHAIDDSEAKPVQTPHASMSPTSQRHSSRQPKQVERYIPEHYRTPSKPSLDSLRRGSSAASAHTVPASAKSRRSSSNTSNTVHVASSIIPIPKVLSGGEALRAGSRDREDTEESELTADEKLARELQAEEHGLRRRASMRA